MIKRHLIEKILQRLAETGSDTTGERFFDLADKDTIHRHLVYMRDERLIAAEFVTTGRLNQNLARVYAVKLRNAGYQALQSELKGTATKTPPENRDLAAGDRKYMQLAIEEAKRCRCEDQRQHPLVGAVVTMEGKLLATSFRGETGPGNHAEFGALEKKLGREVLSGTTVYTTLEPCTTRQHPKVSCAQRLLERGVRRVVIGMVDPNPIISGKGMLLLRSAKIIIEFFPSDLMDIVEEINRDFSRAQRTGAVQPTQLSKRAVWASLENKVISLEPLYEDAAEYSELSDFRVEQVTDLDVKLKKESSGHTIFLPLSSLSDPWRADSYGRMRAKIERGRLCFDSVAKLWIYKST